MMFQTKKTSLDNANQTVIEKENAVKNAQTNKNTLTGQVTEAQHKLAETQATLANATSAKRAGSGTG